MAMAAFSTVKVFSVTLARDREAMGERITEWLKQHPELTPVDVVVRQSSDEEFHCLSVTLFLTGETVAAERIPVVAPKRVLPRPLR